MPDTPQPQRWQCRHVKMDGGDFIAVKGFIWGMHVEESFFRVLGSGTPYAIAAFYDSLYGRYGFDRKMLADALVNVLLDDVWDCTEAEV